MSWRLESRLVVSKPTRRRIISTEAALGVFMGLADALRWQEAEVAL
jgi:hypothetical protein